MATGLSIDIANIQYQRECDFNDILQKLEDVKVESMYFIRKYVFALGKIFSKNIFGREFRQYHFDKYRYITAENHTDDIFYYDGENEHYVPKMSLQEVLDIARELQINKYN
ncbi:MAG: hypothetical protein IJ759_07845 [Bacteroidales bacterium]|nr:hypothetical protein [Bacteroidales bacterium]MBR1775416.1 hypothetical protein [Bacteroidales bacterium]